MMAQRLGNARVILHATFTARTGKADTVATLLADYAATVRTEPGNLRFDPAQHLDAPEMFFVYEEYRDEAAFQAHLRAPYGVKFNAALNPLIVEPAPQLTFLRGF